jgi:hypothetical protein
MIIDTILNLVGKFVPDVDAAKKLAVSLESEMTKQMEMKSSIIQAEIRNGSGKWRVHLMYLCMTIVGAHAVMYDLIPYIRTIFDFNFYIPQAPENAELWLFLRIGVGGYIGGRTIEKTTAWLKGRDNG